MVSERYRNSCVSLYGEDVTDYIFQLEEEEVTLEKISVELEGVGVNNLEHVLRRFEEDELVEYSGGAGDRKRFKLVEDVDKDDFYDSVDFAKEYL